MQVKVEGKKPKNWISTQSIDQEAYQEIFKNLQHKKLLMNSNNVGNEKQ